MRSIPILFLSLAALACSGPQRSASPVEPASDVAAPEPINVLGDVAATASTDTQLPAGLRVRAEVWPETLTPGLASEGQTDQVFIVSPEVPGPWPFVFSLSGPAPEIAAVAIRHYDGDQPSAETVRVCAFLGDVPLDRTSYSRVERGCQPLGGGQLDPARAWTVFTPDEPFYAHYLWVFVDTPAAPFALDEVRALTQADLAALDPSASIAIVALRTGSAEDTAQDVPADGVDQAAVEGAGVQGPAPADTPEQVFDAIDAAEAP